MEYFDPKLEQRVWQRVQGGQNQQPSLAGWILETRQNAAALRQLPATDASRRLVQLAAAQADCLTGIAVLWEQPIPDSWETVSKKERPDSILQRCAGCALRRASAYAQLSGPGEFGEIFADLAWQERLFCRLLLELSGRWHTLADRKIT